MVPRNSAFADRVDAGRQLARALEQAWHGRDRSSIVVLGLPRGGLPVAAEVARALAAPLDVVLVRKLGLPGRPELAMGAIGEDGTEIVDERLIREMGVSPAALADVRERERETLAARAAHLRRGRERLDLVGAHALIVDDGIATGSTAAVACHVVRRFGAERVTLAVPVMPLELSRDPGKTAMFGADVEVVAVRAIRNLGSVGQHYADFSQTTDAEVERLLSM